MMKPSIRQCKVEKVMLIFPPVTNLRIYDKQCCVPLGIAYLGAVLRNRYEVRLLDAVVEGYHLERDLTPLTFQYGLDVDTIVNRIRDFNPEVVGLSCLYSNQFKTVKEIAQKAKIWNPDIVTVIGGTHPTFLPERCLQEESLDYIVLGEAEDSLPALLDALHRGQGHEQINGLAYRTAAQNVIHPKTTWIRNLDDLPFPARDLLPMEKYFLINVPFNHYAKSRFNTSVISSRGCPFHCSFCSSSRYWGGMYRKRSPENVLAELHHLKQTYSIREIKFVDDNLTLDKERAKAIFRGMIDKKLDLHWNMPGGVMIKTLEDDELVGLMKRSGCYELWLPFESGDPWVLKNIIHKNLDLEAARGVVRNLHRTGIDTNAFFIVGLPGEKLKNIQNTFRYIRSMDLDKILIFFFNPQPGTVLYNECVRRRLIDERKVEENDYGLCMISDQDWTKELLEKLVWQEYKRLTFRLIRRKPLKYFKKFFLWKIKNPHSLRTLYQVSRRMIRPMHF